MSEENIVQVEGAAGTEEMFELHQDTGLVTFTKLTTSNSPLVKAWNEALAWLPPVKDILLHTEGSLNLNFLELKLKDGNSVYLTEIIGKVGEPFTSTCGCESCQKDRREGTRKQFLSIGNW